MKSAVFVTIPHAGETLVSQAAWLRGLSEPVLMCDVDRYVDVLYAPALSSCGIDFVRQDIHRYVVDCNRWPEDIDACAVEGVDTPGGTHPWGLHWSKTTLDHTLIKKPLSQALHQELLRLCYEPFFEKVDTLCEKLLSGTGVQSLYHFDFHSMPSRGRHFHRDPGRVRPDVVICTEDGKTASPEWTDFVLAAYKGEGFSVQLNDPYKGGTIILKYGNPKKNRQSVMVELNRRLYMDETTKQLLPKKAEVLQGHLKSIINKINKEISG